MAEVLGLRHVQYARIDPSCMGGHPHRADLEVSGPQMPPDASMPLLAANESSEEHREAGSRNCYCKVLQVVTRPEKRAAAAGSGARHAREGAGAPHRPATAETAETAETLLLLSQDVRSCSRFSADVLDCAWRRKACAPSHQALCEATVQQVAPIDMWLYARVRRSFRKRVLRAGPAFSTRVDTFNRASVGMWKGGAPSREPMVL